MNGKCNNFAAKLQRTNDSLGVLLQLCRQLNPGQVSLEQNIGLDVRVIELAAAG